MLAALVFLPFLRTRGNSLKTVGLYMLVGAMQLGVMYMLGPAVACDCGAGAKYLDHQR